MPHTKMDVHFALTRPAAAVYDDAAARGEIGPKDKQMGVEADELRRVMRQWATGVTLVTAQDGGKPHGMTVSSFTSLSLDPPLVMISLENMARTHRMVTESGAFAVSILDEAQEDLADRFAGRIPDGEDRFAGVRYETARTGSPLPEGVLAYIDCEVVSSQAAGTHTVFVGRVVASGVRPGGQPLLYYNRNYRRLAG
jgi:flavin reductase (DIM6/NTAB) family NADH-FMN oxidoreductase RutF